MIAFILMFTAYFRKVRAFLSDPELRPIFISGFVILSIGAVFYHKVEGWTWLDSVYFCVVSLATIGYGDLTPKTPFGKLFTIIYILVGISVAALFIQTITADSSRFGGKMDKHKKREEV